MKRVAVSFARMALWKRAVLALVLVLVAAVAIAPSAGSPRTIPNGVRIVGVNVSGLDAGQARQQISARFGTPLRFRFGESAGRSRRSGSASWSPSRTPSRALPGGQRRERGRSRRRRPGAGAPLRRRAPGALRLPCRRTLDSSGSSRAGRRSPTRRGASRCAGGRWWRGSRACSRRESGRTIPLVTKTLKPTVTRANFGPVIVIHRGSNRLALFNGEKPWRSFRVATGRRSTRRRPAASASSTCRRTPGGGRRPTPTGRRA